MGEIFEMYEPMTLWDTPTSTSSQGSAAFPLVSNGQESLNTSASLQVASPARISAMQANEQGLKANDLDSGKRCTVSFAIYDPTSCLWRTWQLSLAEELIPYSETWPRAGMMLNGKCYQRQPL